MVKHDTPDRRSAVQRATFERLSGKKQVETTVDILLDPQLSDEADEAQVELDTLIRQDRIDRQGMGLTQAEAGENRKKITAARDRLSAAQDAAAAETVTMRFRQMRRTDYQALIEAHEPTDADKENGLMWNSDTFPPALVAASCIEPVLTAEQAEQLMDDWNAGEARLLFNTALQVNTQRKVAELGKDSGGTDSSTPSLTSATSGGSPTPSTSVDPGPDEASPSGPTTTETRPSPST